MKLVPHGGKLLLAGKAAAPPKVDRGDMSIRVKVRAGAATHRATVSSLEELMR